MAYSKNDTIYMKTLLFKCFFTSVKSLKTWLSEYLLQHKIYKVSKLPIDMGFLKWDLSLKVATPTAF